MAYIRHQEAHEHFRDRVLDGIKLHFPVVGRHQTLHLDKLEVEDNLHPDDLRGQYKAKVTGNTWASPVHATLTLKNNATGQVLDSKKIKVAEIPQITRRYSYIVNGQEYQIDNQWQLRPGIYTQRRQNGELESRFNVVGRSAFDLVFHPDTKQFVMEYNDSKIPLYPIMKAMGVSDAQMEKTWGKEIYEANKNARRVSGALEQFAKTTKRPGQEGPKDSALHVQQVLSESRLHPEATELTVGKRFDKVDGDALHLATQKLLKVQSGHPEDDRDSLVFKELRSVGDYAHDLLRQAKRDVKVKVDRKIDKNPDIRNIIKFETLNKPLREVFTKNTAARVATQINPAEMVSASLQTTILGPGGISSERSVTDEAKLINPSHFGFVDPINTPEGCFDSETQVFTRKGWVFWDAVDQKTEFACLVGGRLEFHKPLELQKYEYEGTMYGVRKPWFEYLVTPNHRVLCRPYDSPGKSSYRVVRADQVHGKPRLFPITHAASSGVDKEFFELPPVEGNNSSVSVEHVDMHDWAELMGWFLSEGSCTYDESTSSYQVKLFQSYTVNRENCDRIEALLERLPWAWCITERDNGRLAYAIGVKQLAKYMSQFGKCDEKYIPEYFFDLSPSIRMTLLESLLAGDGRLCATHKNKRQSSQYYTTTSKRLAHDVERLVISLGKAATWHRYRDKRRDEYLDTYEVCILRDKERSALPGKGHYYTQQYKGMVYCATVPGSFLYVRRNSKHPLWMGNSKTGIALRLSSGVKKVGTEPRIPLYDLKTRKVEDVRPLDVLRHGVVLADQVEWKDGHPTPIAKSVKMLGPGNEPTAGSINEARYVMRRPTHFLNITTNLIPFLNNTNGARAGYGSRHLEQAISLVHREAPLVQAGTGVAGDMDTFDKLVGSNAAHRAPVSGTVSRVLHDGIIIKSDDGKHHEVQLYNNFPLNDMKSSLHSEPLVKHGDKVKAGQVIADTNYSRNGTLALGTNLRVGFIPFKGYNFEDGLVISESAAKKLSSQHMYKHEVEAKEGMVFDPKKFQVQHPSAFNRDQYKNIGEDGAVLVGTKVKPGDPLVIAMRPYQLKDRTGMSAIRKSLSGTHTDASLKWEGEHEGEVVSVHKTGDKILVHVKTIEPMRPGDKMCFDADTEVLTSSGWKPVAQVTLDDEVCGLSGGYVVYEKPTAVHSYAHGGRMYRIASQQVDLFVTEEHQLYVEPRNQTFFGLHSPKEVFGKRVSYKKDGAWSAPEMPEVHLPALQVRAGQGGRGLSWLPEKVLPARTYLMLLGMFLSEGNLVDEPNGNYGIEIAQSKPEGVRELESALKGAGLKFCRHGDKYRLYSKQLLEHFRQFGRAKDKFIPADLFQWSKEDLAVLFYWLVWGDGHRKQGRVVNYTTTSRRLADDVQRLCLHVGYAANVDVQEARSFVQNGREYWASTHYVVRVITKKLTPTVNHGHVRAQGGQVEEWVDGYTGPVYCVTVPSHVLYVRRNGKPCWSGNSNRHGGKGIVTTILPDHEMPHTKDGKAIDVAFNPSGIPGRMNVGQVLEVAASKISQKTGKTYVVQNFESGTHDVLEKVQKELKQHSLTDTEELFDPISKKSLGKVLVGPQHMFKLVHQIDKKLAVRPGMTLPGVTSEAAYSQSTLQPAGGGHAGGQAIGALGVYAMLAHGARANLREMQSFKSEGPDPKGNPAKAWPSQHSQVWAAIQTGAPLPTPRPTFAFKKFENMLKGAGINIEKKGHEFILGPLTDKQVLELSNGELKDPTRAVAARAGKGGDEPQPLAGGIFDERITGGHGGNKWSHISLAEPLPNPIFEGPIKHLTGLTKNEYEDVLYGKKAVGKDGRVVDLGHGVTGGTAIKGLLEKIDVKSALKDAEAQLKKAPESKVDRTLKRVKYLRALDQLGAKTPADAYILHHLPVMPPSSRPLAILPSGDIKYDDINGLYKEFGQVNMQLKDPTLQKALTDKRKENLRKDFYDGVRAIMGVHIPYDDAKNKGLLHVISGATPKTGYFQDVLASRRQDLSMRSTIIPEPALGIDEVGLPKHAALQLFAPFVVRNLVQSGGAQHALEAQKKLADAVNGKHEPMVWKALERTMEERPVLLKRDPALHKYSVQAFKARTVNGSAIKIHPLVTGGYNADFDGDTMSAYVPVTSEAVQEAHKMFPSNNLFSEATGKLAYQPSNENVVGLYKLSTVGKQTNHKFDTMHAAIDAMKKGTISYNDVVHIGGKPSTAGRALLANALPAPMQPAVLHDMDMRLGSKGMSKMLTTLAKNHKADYGTVVNKIKDLGNDAVFGVVRHDDAATTAVRAHTLGMDDFKADKESRNVALGAAARKIADIMKKPGMSQAEKETKAIQAWEEAGKHMQVLHEQKMRKQPNNLFVMYEAGVKPKWEQYKQLALAPMLMKDSQGKIIPNPVTKSYGEGLDVASYWTHLHGTRRGTVRKVQEVQEPGYLTKLMQNTASHLHVDQHDCGTSSGVALHIGDQEIHDRYLQQDFKAGGIHVPAGTLLSPDVVAKLRAVDKNAQIVVRSPLRCESDKGICAKCMGLSADGGHHKVGDAVGVHAVHALGERAVQLTLKEFHTGGVTGAAGMSSSLDRMLQLTYLPQKIPDAATLAMTGGKIEKIEKDPTGAKVWIGGVAHHVGRDRFGHALTTHAPGVNSTLHNDKPWEPPHVGQVVEAGHPLSDPTRTTINPHDLYAATKSVEKLQNHLTNEIHKLYRDEGVRRKHVETVVKAMTSVTKIRDPGDSTLLRGGAYPLAHVNKLNQGLKNKVVHEPVIKGVEMLPHDLHTDWMAKLQHERLTGTLTEAAATLGKSSIHGSHPIPALAFGAEFGLTREHAHKPGLGHLQDVPAHHY